MSCIPLMDFTLNERQWRAPPDKFSRDFLACPELLPVPESCAAALALDVPLDDAPTRPVAPKELLAFKDNDARESDTHFLRFRDALLAAGTLEASTCNYFRVRGGASKSTFRLCLLTCW